MYTIAKTFSFDAAHQLPQMPDGHKCKRPHGHTYHVTVELRAAELDGYGFVKDYGELDAVKRDIDQRLDHRDLAALFGGENTTAERLACALFDRWWPLCAGRLSAVVVSETPKTWARYEETNRV